MYRFSCETVNIPGVFAHLYSAVLMLPLKTKVQISLFMEKTCVLMNLNAFFLHKKIFFGGKIESCKYGNKVSGYKCIVFFFFLVDKIFLAIDVLFLFLFSGFCIFKFL
jgi:hypothetical protein